MKKNIPTITVITITIWTNDSDEVKKLWERFYFPGGWDIEKPIEVKWNWRKFEWMYCFKLLKI